MALPEELISAFVEVTNDRTEIKQETTVYGTIVEHDGTRYVRLDGSDLLTPISATADADVGERVTVLIKNHTATVTGNASSPAARKESVDKIGDQITEVEILVADKVSTKQLEAEVARIDQLVADDVIIKGQLTAATASITELEAQNVTISGKLDAAEANIDDLSANKLDAEVADITYATIKNLEAAQADIYNLNATYGEFVDLTAERFTAVEANIDDLSANKLDANTANITYAKIADLDATNAEIDKLDANVADIDTLIFGSASGNTIQTSFANSVIAMLGDAQIKSAMIESVSAGKITAGDIVTNNVRVMSEDGKLLISDETIQISDSTRVRVQIGKDAANDYSINIWDADGNLMFSEGGITDSAIKEAIIRNDMVSDDANISAHKLDIDSLFEEINGSSKTIKATKVYFDDKKQTLDVAFTGLTTEVSDTKETVSSQGTAISVIQGQITSKIWESDIDTAVGEVEGKVNTLTTQYSTLEQEIDGISATVASHTTELDAITGEVADVSDRVTQVAADLSGFRTTVSNTYATKTALSVTDTKATTAKNDVDALKTRVGNAETSIEQNANEIALRATKAEVEAIEVGGRNLLLNSSFASNFNKWTNVGANIVSVDGTVCARIVGTLNDTQRVNQSVVDKIDVDDLTQTYVFSADIRIDDYKAGSTNPYVRLYFSGGYDDNGAYTWMGATTVSGNPDCACHSNKGWVRVAWIVKFDRVPTSMGASIYARDFTGTLYFKNLKLEKGNKVTDWTPAPEDMATVERIETAETLIEQNAEAIELRATKTELNAVSTAANTVQNNLNNNYYNKTETDAKFKLTNDSISMTVKEEIDGLHIGSVNEIRNSDDLIFDNYYFTGDFVVTHDGNGNVTVACGASVTHDDYGNVKMRSATTTAHDGAGNVTTT